MARWTPIVAIFVAAAAALSPAWAGSGPTIEPSASVAALLWELGEPKPAHWIEPDTDRIRQGRELVLEGRTTGDDGRRTRVASPAFLCTDCHHIVREDPDLRVSDPDARLDHAIENDLNLLTGTTLWAMANRLTWFNDDYENKYGSLVDPAREDLRESVRLCSSECSQGRLLEDWELDAILAYLWTLELRLGDLDLSPEELELIALALQEEPYRAQARAVIREAFLPGSPAHARLPPDDRAVGYGNTGDPARGGEVYRRACLVCHQATPGDRRGVRGTYPLSEREGSLKKLWRNRTGGSLSFYQVISWGTRPFGVPMAYMPFFTKERLSDQQIDDLRAFLASELGLEE